MTQKPLAMHKADDQEPESQQNIRDYLLDNPDFFDNNPDLLTTISLPHESGQAVSLVERQVTVLRERNMEMRHRLNNMLETARENDKLFDCTKRLVLGLLEADDLGQLIETLYNSLKADFGIEYSALKLIRQPGILELPTLAAEHLVTEKDAQLNIGPLMRNNRPLCGILREQELKFLFGEQADQVGSVAAVAIGYGKTIGFLAMGNRDPNFYRSSMGTLFLSYIADVLGRVIPRLQN